MSGKKQHYIPKVLLKEFRANQRGKYGQAFVYKSGKVPYLSSIADIAAERYFYSDLGDGTSKTLDDRITDYENTLTSLLRSLQDIANGRLADPLVSAEVVAHLSIRGAYLREMFSSGARQLIQGTSDSWSDPDIVRAILFLDEFEGTPIFVASIDNEIEKIRHTLPSGFPIPLLKRLLLYFARESFDSFHESFFPSIDTALKQLVPQVSGAMRSGHARVFDTSMAPDKRVSDLATLSWHVHRSETALILPDCVAVSVDKTWTSMQPYLMESIDNVGAIMLPLAFDKMLVGLPVGASENRANFDFNSHAAGCSAVFFVSSEDSGDVRALADNIGNVTDRTISSIVSDTLRKAYPRSDDPANGLEDKTPLGAISPEGEYPPQSTQSSDSFSYRVNFRDCATQEQAETIAKIVAVVVNGLASHLELDHLEAIIFAEDYPASLRELDRELTTPANLGTTAVEGLVGVASTVSDYVEGHLKSYVVMRSWLGYALVSGDEDPTRVATHMLSAILSQASFSMLLESAFGEASAHPPYSPREALLYAPMNGAPAAYYSAWMSAHIDPSAEDSYREVVLRMLDHANELIDSERLGYESHKDLDRFLHQATQALGDLLMAIAKLIGHCDASNSSIYGDSANLRSAFERQSLSDWVSLYSQDLRRVFASRGVWRSTKDLRSLCVHMERHLWRYLVFPWIMEDGQVWVEVPNVG